MVGQRKTRGRVAVAACALFALASSGCLKQLILEGQIASTRKASAAVNTIPDYEVAEKIAMAGIGQLEGMRYLAPDNEDALFSLTRAWSSVAFGFIEDQMEQAEDNEGSVSPNYDYHRRRAQSAYARAIWFGSQLLEQKHEGFKAAQKNADTIKAYLTQFDDPETDPEILFWLGQAWLGRTGVSSEKGEVVGELFVAVALLERSAELNEQFLFGSAHVLLGAYHARSTSAELDEAEKHFKRALEISDGKTLLPKLQYAIRYHCAKGDKASYTKYLEEVLAAGDGDGYSRLANTIAKRRAGRWLGADRMRAACGF
jgi:tetratricopeptide (TPR) repeat protein